MITYEVSLDASRPCVVAALRDARAPLDDRRLMPLAEARRIVRAARAFRRGEAREVDGTMVLESDTVWAALLSLEDTSEFVEEATRLSWETHVRGRENVAPLERYGAGILPWLRSRLRPDGALVNIPWCVVPCLLAIDGAEALELALATHAVHELLDGQPALGWGPGAFAVPGGVRESADAVTSDAPARAFLSPTEGLDLARRWIAKKPSGYGALAELASGGNVRAVALLHDRALALGGVVVEALAASVGLARAAELVGIFDLPRPALAAGVRAVLDAAPEVDVPRGPVWSVAELDDAARQYELPLWDNLSYTTAAMRLTGFASAKGDVLTVESIESSPLQNEPLRWRMCAYGPGATEREASEALIDEGDLDDLELDGDGAEVDVVTNHLRLGGRVVPAPFPFAYQGLTVKRALSSAKPVEIRSSYQLPASFAALPDDVRAKLRHGVVPINAMIFRMCAEHVDAMWPDDAELLRAAGGPAGARVLFRFDALAWPRAGEPASSSDDLVAITEALRTRRAIARLPSVPNTRPEHWLRFPDEIDPDHDVYDPWGGEAPLEAPPREPATGIDAYWSDMLARGWPHGVMLMHGPEWNRAGQAEQTVRYLLDSPVQAMHVFWPRRAACLFLRAVGALEASYAAKDPGAAKGMAKDTIVELDEARGIVRALATRRFAVPAHVGAEVVQLLEAFVDGPHVVALFADALAELPAEDRAADRPALAAAVFELGFVLRRIRTQADASRQALARAFDPARTNDVGRALDLVLHGRAGAERSARAELDYVHVHDDLAWARARILDPATPASPIDAVLSPLGGDALLDKWGSRLGAATDPRWLAAQLCVLGGDRALALALRLYVQRKDARDPVKAKLADNPGAAEALERLTAGPDGPAARELLDALRA